MMDAVLKKAAGRAAGIGTDLVRIERLAKSLARTANFASSIFSQAEMAFCSAKARPAQHYAARFAAKEAFLKAMGMGVFQGIPLPEIELVREENNPPRMRLGPAAMKALTERGYSQVMVSVSHDGDYAIAFVLVQ